MGGKPRLSEKPRGTKGCAVSTVTEWYRKMFFDFHNQKAPGAIILSDGQWEVENGDRIRVG